MSRPGRIITNPFDLALQMHGDDFAAYASAVYDIERFECECVLEDDRRAIQKLTEELDKEQETDKRRSLAISLCDAKMRLDCDEARRSKLEAEFGANKVIFWVTVCSSPGNSGCLWGAAHHFLGQLETKHAGKVAMSDGLGAPGALDMLTIARLELATRPRSRGTGPYARTAEEETPMQRTPLSGVELEETELRRCNLGRAISVLMAIQCLPSTAKSTLAWQSVHDAAIARAMSLIKGALVHVVHKDADQEFDAGVLRVDDKTLTTYSPFAWSHDPLEGLKGLSTASLVVILEKAGFSKENPFLLVVSASNLYNHVCERSSMDAAVKEIGRMIAMLDGAMRLAIVTECSNNYLIELIVVQFVELLVSSIDEATAFLATIE